MCLCMFMAKQAVGVQLGDDMVQGGVDGQEPVQEHIGIYPSSEKLGIGHLEIKCWK